MEKIIRMKNVLLIDADSIIPNIVLMKISGYLKEKGYNIELLKLNLSYYPQRKNKIYYIKDNYDKCFCSVVFNNNYKFIKGNNITFGGTGSNRNVRLKEIIENDECDYSIYPENDISYGFISRGCIRKCKFCIVPEKEGYIRQVSTIDKIVKHKKVKFLDNNFLALRNHKKLLKELIDKNINCQFNQGLDIRLIDCENSILLSELNYLGDYIFSFDDYNFLNILKDKLKILNWRKEWRFKFFVYCHPDMKVSNVIKRIEFLKNEKCLPYLMRDFACWDSIYKKFYIDLSAWCNQPGIFKNMEFKEFLEKKHEKRKNYDRIKANLSLYENNK